MEVVGFLVLDQVVLGHLLHYAHVVMGHLGGELLHHANHACLESVYIRLCHVGSLQ